MIFPKDEKTNSSGNTLAEATIVTMLLMPFPDEAVDYTKIIYIYSGPRYFVYNFSTVTLKTRRLDSEQSTL